jgi:hypothetical protein
MYTAQSQVEMRNKKRDQILTVDKPNLRGQETSLKI